MTAVSYKRRSVVLSGTTQAMNGAFGVDLQQYEHAAGSYRGRTGTVSVRGSIATGQRCASGTLRFVAER